VNKLLRRQIDKFIGESDSVPEELESLLKAISDAYDGFDVDQKLVERSLDISSRELTGNNRALRQEIDERKQVEERLRHAAQEWRTTFDSITDLVSIHDKDFKIVRVNKAFADTFGMKPKEIIGKTCYELVHGTKEPLQICPHKQTLDTKKPHGAEFFEPHLGVYLEVSASPIFDENGEIIATVHIAKNITERKQAEEALRLFSQAVDSSADGIAMGNLEGMITYVNEAFARMFDYSREELIGKDIASIYTEEMILKLEEALKATIEGNWTGELIGRRKNGVAFPMMISSSRVLDDEGKVIAQMASHQDITERKLAEQKQTELIEQVESVNRELKDFAYVVSHDLKAPLRGISTLANWIATDYSDKLDEDGKEQLDLLVGRVDRMHALIEGILQYSRIGCVKEERIRVDLNELVPKVIDMVTPPESIEVTVEDELPVIECEETRIIQVFQNLLSNAVKYMDKPQGQIRINCDEEDSFWKFSVADNGPGIEQEQFERIFQIFQTLSPRDEFESTGVGLSVVKKIVELYGGNIWVESEMGKGSTFFFALPKQEMGVKDARLEAGVAC
jgi:PAS domain S-box-containing protein